MNVEMKIAAGAADSFNYLPRRAEQISAKSVRESEFDLPTAVVFLANGQRVTGASYALESDGRKILPYRTTPDENEFASLRLPPLRDYHRVRPHSLRYI